MSVLRSALVDFCSASGADIDSFDLLLPVSEGKPKRFSAKPNAIDDFVDHAIDTAKWAVAGAITEQSYLGLDGLRTVAPATPQWDAAGVIYKPAILAQVGRMVMARLVAEHPVEVALGFQEFAYTVDNPATPTTWTLGYLTTPQDLRNTMGVIWRAGSLYFFEGGAPGNEEYLGQCPWRGSAAGAIFPLQVAFVFTAAGWEIWAHLPGIWSEAKLLKTYTRPGGAHAALGYSFCWNKYTADDAAMFYNMAFEFKSNALLLGAKVVAANAIDYVFPASLVLNAAASLNSSKAGAIRVRFPDLGTTLYTPDELVQVTTKLTGKNLYAVDFELNGDMSLDHPARITIEDATLEPAPATPA
jgi:hypothetical protein